MDHREDNAKVKRTELVLHTKMTTLDGFVELKDLFKRLDEWGHTGVAITDAGSVQCYPEAYALGKKYNKKVLYGLELRLLTDFLPIAYSCDGKDRSSDVTVFDIETTGFSKYNDRITDRRCSHHRWTNSRHLQTLVNPEMVISEIANSLGLRIKWYIKLRLSIRLWELFGFSKIAYTWHIMLILILVSFLKTAGARG